MHGTPFLAKLVTFFALTIVGNVWAEHWLEENFKPVTTSFLYESAGRLKSAQDIPVTVLDISMLYDAGAQWGTKPKRPLNRQEMTQVFSLFEKMIEKGHRPVGLGFDMDFTGDEDEIDRQMHRETIALAREFMAKTGVPVWLGVAQNIAPSPGTWLPAAPASMAAAIVLQSDLDYQPLGYGPSKGGRSTTLPTLGVALGRKLYEEVSRLEYEENGAPFRIFAPSLITRHSKIEAAAGDPLEKLAGTDWDEVESFLVDYEPNRLRSEFTYVFDKGLADLGQDGLQQAYWSAFDGKVVLIGAAVGPDKLGDWIRWQSSSAGLGPKAEARPSVGSVAPDDTFQVQRNGFPTSPASYGESEVIRGIYAHACAAYSYSQRPMRKFDGFAALFLTTVISICMFCIHCAHGSLFARDPEPTTSIKFLARIERLCVRMGTFLVSLICFPILGSRILAGLRKKDAKNVRPFRFRDPETHSHEWKNFETAVATIAYPLAAIILATLLAKYGILWFGFVAAVLYVLGEAFLEPVATGLLTVLASLFASKKDNDEIQTPGH